MIDLCILQNMQSDPDSDLPQGLALQPVTHPDAHHLIIPGLGQQLYQESLTMSKTHPAGELPTTEGPLQQYYPTAVPQAVQFVPTGTFTAQGATFLQIEK